MEKAFTVPVMAVMRDNWQYAGLAGYYVSSLAIDATNSDIVYAGCWDYKNASGGVFLSINGGHNWAAINLGLGTTQINTITINPNNHYQLFAGTSNYGVWDYTIQNYPPVVEIVAPELDFFEYNSPISLVGYAADQEEGILPDSMLSWRSSIQGELGIGDTLTIDSLSQVNIPLFFLEKIVLEQLIRIAQ